MVQESNRLFNLDWEKIEIISLPFVESPDGFFYGSPDFSLSRVGRHLSCLICESHICRLKMLMADMPAGAHSHTDQ